MDLIANIAAWVLAFFASVLGNIWAHDICASADRTCTKIVRGAARRLAPFDQESGEQEWLADLNDRLTVREKYQHAIGCYLVAGKMRRAAIKVTLVLCFHIDAVGDVPLDFNVGSKLFLYQLLDRGPCKASLDKTLRYCVWALIFFPQTFAVSPTPRPRPVQDVC